MLVSLEWLRTLCPVEADAARVTAALTERGLTVDGAATTAGGDTVLELDVPANRPDWLGHRGVARELAAAFGVPLAPPAEAPAPVGESIEGRVRVTIEDPEPCPRYTARVVRGVRVGPSPPWVVERLEACGLRSRNNVVDASNLVMLELGNPIHFFDLARVERQEIVVRRAREGERLATLDGVDRTLDPEMLVIADPARAVALAGVIGGADTEISDVTTDVLIEAAYFDPPGIRRTARRLGIGTDASHRFERGVDPESVPAAQALAVRLLAELADGKPAPGLIDAYPRPVARPRLRLRPERVERLLGYAPSIDEARAALEALELPAQPDGGALAVAVPSWRVDLLGEADLVEEVARHLGYDRIPAARAVGAARLEEQPARESLAVEERTRDVLAHLGFHEAFSYAMVGEGEDTPFTDPEAPPALALENPIAAQLSHLRRSVLPGLLRAADLNLRRGADDVRLFEVGRVFVDRGAGRFPDERLHLGLAWSGAAAPAHWSAPPAEVGLYDIAGIVERIVDALRPGTAVERGPGALPGLHPGRSIAWRLDSGAPLACCGALHPERRAALDLTREVWVAELDLARLAALPPAVPSYRPLPRFPSAARDLSLVVERSLTFDRIREVIAGVPAPAPARVEVIDRFEGEALGPDRVSLTVRLTLEPHDRTLRDEETEAYRLAVIAALEGGLGVALRG